MFGRHVSSSIDVFVNTAYRIPVVLNFFGPGTTLISLLLVGTTRLKKKSCANLKELGIGFFIILTYNANNLLIYTSGAANRSASNTRERHLPQYSAISCQSSAWSSRIIKYFTDHILDFADHWWSVDKWSGTTALCGPDQNWKYVLAANSTCLICQTSVEDLKRSFFVKRSRFSINCCFSFRLFIFSISW